MTCSFKNRRLAQSERLPELSKIYSTNPRSRKFIERRQFKFNPLVKSLPPFGFFDYNKLQTEARCVFLDKCTIILGGLTERKISQAVALVIERSTENFIEANDYVDTVSIKVVKIIQSYTNVVNRTIWRKQF